MTKSNFFFFLFIFVFLNSFSQKNTFVRTYNLPSMNGGLALAIHEDGGFIGTGQHDDLGCKVYAYRVDECGNLIWLNLYHSGGGLTIYSSEDNGIIIGGEMSGASLLKIDDDGNSEWSKSYSGIGGYICSVIETSNGSYFAGATSAVIKTDSIGEIEWAQSVSGGKVHAVDEFSNGDLMFFSTDFGSTNFIVGRMTPDGTIIWEYSYGIGGATFVDHSIWAGEALIDESDNIVITSNIPDNNGDIIISKINSSGYTMTSKRFGSQTSQDITRSISTGLNGGYVIAGATYGYGADTSLISQNSLHPAENISGRNILIVKVDNDLELEWSSVIGSTGNDKGIGVRANNDNGYTISAYTDGAFFNSDSFDPLFIKTDSLGQINCQQYSPEIDSDDITFDRFDASNSTPLTVTTNSLSFNTTSINPNDYYMCLDCSTSPDFYISDTTICIGDTTYFVNESSGLICYQSWFVDGVPIPTEADSIAYVFETSGNHTVRLETNCGSITTSYELDIYVNYLDFDITSVSNYNGYEVSCNGGNDGFLETTAFSPYPPINFSWNNGTNSSNIYSIEAGEHSLVISDDFGCVIDTTIIFTEPTAIQSIIQSVNDYNGYDVSCYGNNDGEIVSSVSGGISPYTIGWSNFGGNVSNSYNIDNLEASTYFLNVIDDNGCIYNANIVLNEPTALVSNLSSANSYNGYDISCYGYSDGEINSDINGGISPYFLSWSNGFNSQNISNLSQGDYQLEITDLNGCTQSSSIILSEPNELTSNIQSANNYNGFEISCTDYFDGEIDLTINGGVLPYNFNWNNGVTSEDLVNVAAGSYNVSITDANNCQISSAINLSEPTPFSFSSTISDYNGYNISCFNGNNGFIDYTIGGSVSPYNFNWNGPNGFTSSNEDINNLSSGDYSLQVIDDNGCLHSASFELIEPSILISEINSLTDYNGYNISCHGFNDGAIEVEYSGGVPSYYVLWESGESSDILTNLSASDYLSVVIRDLNNCQIIDSVQLIEPSPLTSSISSVFDYNGYEISCHNYTDGGINLDIFGGVGPYSTSWNNGETVEDLNNLSEGLYSVSIVDQNNCSNSNQITLNEPTPLNLNFDISNYNGFNISCNGFEDGFINTLVSGSVPPYSYEWNTGLNTQNLFLLSSDNYSLQVSDLNNCEIFGEAFLTQPNDFFISLNFSSDTCSKGIGNGKVYITPESNPYQILWSNGETDYEINNLFSGNNSLSVTDMYGCEKSIDFFTGDLTSPIANFYMEPENDSLFFQVNSNLNFFDESTDSWSIINSWNWDFGDGNSDTTMNTSHAYNSIGYYNVLLRIHNIHGCMDTVSKILEISDFIIHFPNAFTPQGDLINERFTARGINVKELHMTIYSRWGEQIFITTDINEGWNGTYQSTGKKCPQGVYVYDVHITDAFGDLHRFTGDVTLID